MNNPALRYLIVIATAAVLQYTVVTQFRIFGVSADLFLVIAVAAGMIGGAERGAIVGFASGLCLDLMVTTPFGLCAISGLVAGVVAGLLEEATVHSARWLTMAIASMASVVGIVSFAIAGTLLGRPDLLSGHLVKISGIVGIASAALVFPALRACRWADPEDSLLRAAAR